MDLRQATLERRAIVREIELENIVASNARHLRLYKDLLREGKEPPAELTRCINRDLETAELISSKGLSLRDAQQRVAQQHRIRRERR